MRGRRFPKLAVVVAHQVRDEPVTCELDSGYGDHVRIGPPFEGGGFDGMRSHRRTAGCFSLFEDDGSWHKGEVRYRHHSA